MLLLVLAVGCSPKTTRLDLYWPHDLWDGMNRMVFALQELGYEIRTVDTDNGTILARKQPQPDEPRTLPGVHSRVPYELVIQFPVNPKEPILIRQAPAGSRSSDLGEKDLQKVVNAIARKYQEFGGVVVEVKAAG
jgi:hypothetical protein